ncbi:3',5'-cyclic-nucleotide phosphodiesterase [bacterium]|nr:3',5'-cyclic-nucleotide phosphodiesterase [bacterium]
MKIKVVGAYGAALSGYHLTTFILNDNIALDAGSLNRMDLEEQLNIDHIFITHAHLDHITGIAFFIDNIFSLTDKTIHLHAIPPVIKAIRDHLFNSDVWVDFTKLPDSGTPRIDFATIEYYETMDVGGVEITPLPTNHIVPSSGFHIKQDGKNFLYTGDMIEAPEMWDYVNKLDYLDAMIIEVSFPDRLLNIAKVSKHLCPSLLREELKKLKHQETDIYIYHIKPMFIDDIVQDLFPKDVDLALQLLYEDEIIEI